ncbi:MAG: WGR domain-containing protein [Neisseriales bacterium]|nr:MAG: WGR domain-containing protein [Neisseriales bacterium]
MIYMIHPTKSRFYWLSINQDLFGNWCVVKVYGGIGKKSARHIWEPCESKTIASQRMFDIECLRRKRGYIYANTNTPDDYILTPEVIA